MEVNFVNYHIIPMTAARLPHVAALEKICFPADPWSETLFRAALDDPRAVILLAEGKSGEILGYAVLFTVLDEGNLDNIAVAPAHRRQGVADVLLGTIVRFGREHLSTLTLEVRASNAPALALYEKHGFAAVGRRKNYYSDPKEDAILMTLDFAKEISTDGHSGAEPR